MKKLLGITVLMVMLMSAVCYAGDGISITVDGNLLQTDTPAQIIEGRTMVPLRAIFEAVGADVKWNSTDKSISANKGDISINMKIDSSSFEVNGEEKSLDVPPQIINGRTMLPVRAVAESLDCDVEWDNGSKTVIITTARDIETKTEVTTETTTITTTETTTEAFWVKLFMEKDNKPEPVKYDVFDTEIVKEYHIKGRKNFESNFSKNLIMGNNTGDDIYNLIKENKTKDITDKIEDCWNDLVNRYAEEYMTNINDVDAPVAPDVTISSNMEYYDKMRLEEFSSQTDTRQYTFREDCHLLMKDNLQYTYTKYGKNAVVLLFSLSDEEEVGTSSYIVIFVNNKNDILTYKLEKDEDNTYVLKENEEIKEKGLENDKKTFLVKVDELVSNNADFAK